MHSKKSLTKLQFLNENYSPSEANEIVIKFIDEQIKQYKLQNLSRWIGDQNCDQKPYYDKIEQLQSRKQELIEMTNQAKAEGAKLNFSGDLHLSIAQ